MADRLRQFCQFLIGIGTFQTLEDRLSQGFGRWAAEGLGLRGVIHSHSTINDIMSYPGMSRGLHYRSSKSGIEIAVSPAITGVVCCGWRHFRRIRTVRNALIAITNDGTRLDHHQVEPSGSLSTRRPYSFL